MGAFDPTPTSGSGGQFSADPSQPQQQSQQSQGQGQSPSAEEFVDINDARLASEPLDDNTAEDAYAVPPPPSDGKWRAKLRAMKIKDSRDGQEKDFIAAAFPRMANGRPFLATNIEVSLIDLSGHYDGVKITEYWVKTLIDDRKGTSQLSTIVTKSGGKLPARTTDKERMDIALKHLAREPEVIVDLYWEASCQACQEAAKQRGDRAPKPFLRGMHRFPVRNGKPDPEVQCPTCKSVCRAQPRVAAFLSVTDAKATQGL